MPLRPDVSACSTCRTVTVTDATGAYSEASNPGGWGAPNIERVDAVSITLEVTPPHWTGDPLTFDLLTDAPSPDVSGNYVFNYVPADFGLNTITSGLWSFRIVVVDVDDVTLSSSRCMKLFFGEIANSIRQEFLKIDERTIADHADQLAGYLILVGATWNARCGKPTRAQDQIDWLYKNVQDCNC